MLATFVAYAVLIGGLLVSLSLIGIDLTAFTIILGGLSVGFGFGMQDVISNFVSGFILLFERSIGPGDIVEIEGNVGEVREVGIRSMRIRTNDNVELIVPNTTFLTNIVTTYTRGDRRVRVRVPVGVQLRLGAARGRGRPARRGAAPAQRAHGARRRRGLCGLCGQQPEL